MKGRLILLLVSILLITLTVMVGCQPNTPPDKTDPTATPEPTVDPKVFTDGISGVKPDENKVMQVNIIDEGYDIYAYTEGQTWGYRYGPTMLRYPDGSMDAWFAAPGTKGEWDWFTYRHSSDSGANWTDEITVLQPIADSMDFYSVCDPGVVYFGGWYYMGYTSTIYEEGIGNNGFVARSRNPEGPYEKWNGSGWGGKPAPIVYYTGDKAGWGVGEMSFVVVDNILYVYYTWKTPSSNTTRVSIADATNENWPATMEYKGIAMKYQTGGEDSADVKYVEDYGKFIAINTGDRMGPQSYLGIWESNDGITFTRTNKLYTNVIYYCHNAGFMSRPDGHINLKDKLYLGYAYGGTSNEWGRWNTRVHEFTITLVDQVDPAEAKNKNNKKIDVEHWPVKDLWTVGVSTSTHHYERKISEGAFNIEVIWVDTYFKTHVVDDPSNVKISDYDGSIVSFDGFKCTPKKVGQTFVTVEYDGLQNIFVVSVRDENVKLGLAEPAIAELSSCFKYPTTGPVGVDDKGNITVSLSNKTDKAQIKAFAIFEDGRWFELFNDTAQKAPYSNKTYKVSYDVADESIIKVSNTGIVTARQVGKTTVTVSCQGKSFTLEVTVVD